MNKYQLNLLQRGTISFVSEAGNEKSDFSESLTLQQNQNYLIGDYRILFTNPSIESVTYLGVKYTSKENTTTVPFNFGKKPGDLRIAFKNQLADDCLLAIVPILADKKAFDDKVAKENADQLKKNVALFLGKGINLINVFWKKANASVTKSIIKLQFQSPDGVTYDVLQKETDKFYLSLSGLAFGNYQIRVEEYIDDELLVSVESSLKLDDHPTELQRTIKESADKLTGQVRASGKHTVVI